MRCRLHRFTLAVIGYIHIHSSSATLWTPWYLSLKYHEWMTLRWFCCDESHCMQVLCIGFSSCWHACPHHLVHVGLSGFHRQWWSRDQKRLRWFTRYSLLIWWYATIHWAATFPENSDETCPSFVFAVHVFYYNPKMFSRYIVIMQSYSAILYKYNFATLRQSSWISSLIEVQLHVVHFVRNCTLMTPRIVNQMTWCTHPPWMNHSMQLLWFMHHPSVKHSHFHITYM